MVGWRDYKVNQLVADQIAPMLLSVGVHELRVVDERVVDHPPTVDFITVRLDTLISADVITFLTLLIFFSPDF